MGRWNNANLSWEAATGYKVMIYSSIAAATANFNGDVFDQVFTPGQVTVDNTWIGGANNVAKFTVSGLNIDLTSAGDYWVAVAPVIDFATAGQSGITGSIWTGNTPGGLNGWQTNPGGGFAFPGNNQQINPGTDLAYRVSGTVVPEPGTFVAIGLGLAAIALRRRSK
jgi:hypothetical protein